MLGLLFVLVQENVVERYLSEKDASLRAKILADVKASPAEIESELRRPPRRPVPEARGQLLRRRLKTRHALGIEFEYALWVPKDYTPAKQWRLIVSLHGQGGNGPDFVRNWLADVEQAGDTFLLAPSAGRGGWGHSLLGHHYVLDSIRDVLGTYAIDPDLVFIDGASMGGNGSFQFVCAYPDLFAGAAPRSGGPLFRYTSAGGKKERSVVAEGLGNLLATPLYWTVGAKDPELNNAWVKTAKAQIDALKLDCVFHEYPEGGHEWFPQENATILQWMGTKRRSAYPTRVGIQTHDRLFSRAFWLEIADFREKEIIKRGFKDLEGRTIEERLAFSEEVQVTGELLRETNEIRVTAIGAREIKVYLDERMVDFARPLAIVVNGSRSTHPIRPSVETLLESARRDRGLLYAAWVKVRVP